MNLNHKHSFRNQTCNSIDDKREKNAIIVQNACKQTNPKNNTRNVIGCSHFITQTLDNRRGPERFMAILSFSLIVCPQDPKGPNLALRNFPRDSVLAINTGAYNFALSNSQISSLSSVVT